MHAGAALQSAQESEGVGVHKKAKQAGLFHRLFRDQMAGKLDQPGRDEQKNTPLDQPEKAAQRFVEKMQPRQPGDQIQSAAHQSPCRQQEEKSRQEEHQVGDRLGHGGGHRRRGAGGDLRHALFHGTVHRADRFW